MGGMRYSTKVRLQRSRTNFITFSTMTMAARKRRFPLGLLLALAIQITIPPNLSDYMPVEIEPPKLAVYSRCRTDRSGSVIQDMLLAHAYAYAHGLEYKGACVEKELKWLEKHRALVKVLGLEDVLRFDACSVPNAQRLSPDLYEGDFETYWTADWRDHIRSLRSNREAAAGDRVAVHVRRGDIRPCSKFGNRYLTNHHYLSILGESTNVTVFTERDPYESVADFRRRRYSVVVEGDEVAVWRAFLASNMLVTSVSSFSYVPAVLKTVGTVVYTPYAGHPAMDDWIVVDDEATSRNRDEVSAMRQREGC